MDSLKVIPPLKTAQKKQQQNKLIRLMYTTSTKELRIILFQLKLLHQNKQSGIWQ